MDRQTMPEASRLTPERLRGVFVEVPITTRSVADYAQELYPRLCAYGDAWDADIADSGKEIGRLREQLRAYRGAERIAHDNLEAAE